jgi:hypothetical protein
MHAQAYIRIYARFSLRGELPENALKLVQKVHTGPVNRFLRVYCAAPSFDYYSRAVSPNSFIRFFTWTSVWR